MSVSRPRCKSKRHISEQDTVEQGGLFANTLPLVFRPTFNHSSCKKLGFSEGALPNQTSAWQRTVPWFLSQTKHHVRHQVKSWSSAVCKCQHFLTSNTMSHLIPSDQAISGLGNNTSLSTTMIWRMRPQRRDMEAISGGSPESIQFVHCKTGAPAATSDCIGKGNSWGYDHQLAKEGKLILYHLISSRCITGRPDWLWKQKGCQLTCSAAFI